LDNEILHLFRRFINNQCSHEELDIVLKHIKEANYEEELAYVLSEEAERISENSADQLSITDQNLDLLTRINSSIDNSTIAIKRQKFLQYVKYMAAATVLVVSAIAIYIYVNATSLNTKFQAPVKTASTVTLDENEAYLTLANGKRIALSESNLGSLAHEVGADITKTKDNELVYKPNENDVNAATETPLYNKIEIPNGKKFQLNLPDGTKVWLNAGTSLRYPVSFAGLKERGVDLVGEAYFEVAHNKAVPFKVYIGKKAVEVLGTKFNVNSYQNEPAISTTLLDGSVKIISDNDDPSAPSVIIQPGEQASITPHKISINKIDTEEVMAWKNGQFNFKSQDFQTVMRSISRWYDLEVVYENTTPITVKPGGWISRKNNVKEVLEMIEATGKVKFKIEERRIIVKN